MINRLTRPFAWIAVLVFVFGASFGVVRAILRDDPVLEATPRDPRQSLRLAPFCEELDELFWEFDRRMAPYSTAQTAQHRQWVDYNFRPRANDLRQRLVQIQAGGESYDSLLFAADRLAALAANPESRRARDASYRAVQAADRLVKPDAGQRP